MAKAAAGVRGLPNWVWPAVAFVSMAGFFAYLYYKSWESRVEVVEGEASAAGRRVTADVAAFTQAPARYSGRVVRLDSVVVVERFGRATFGIRLPGRPRYPVALERHLVEEGVQVTRDDRVNLVGSVYALNDSIVRVWAQRGFLDPARQGEFASDSTFFLADSVEILVPLSSPGGDGAAAPPPGP